MPFGHQYERQVHRGIPDVVDRGYSIVGCLAFCYSSGVTVTSRDDLHTRYAQSVARVNQLSQEFHQAVLGQEVVEMEILRRRLLAAEVEQAKTREAFNVHEEIVLPTESIGLHPSRCYSFSPLPSET